MECNSNSDAKVDEVVINVPRPIPALSLANSPSPMSESLSVPQVDSTTNSATDNPNSCDDFQTVMKNRWSRYTGQIPPSVLNDTTSSTMLEALANLTSHANLELIFKDLKGVHQQSNRIFERIEAKDYKEVAKILSEKGQKVSIDPKIGCSKIFYTRLNVANMRNKRAETPLIVAAKVSYQMVDMVLKHGGDPNVTNTEGDSPLSIAAVRGDRDSVNALLNAGADLNAAVIKLTAYLRFQTEADIINSGFETGFSVKSLTFLLSDDVYLKCRDPFRAAFDVSKSIGAIVDVRDEFKMDFELLIRDADVFTYKMLDHCDRMSEARDVLDRSYGLLRKAINEGKTKFVGHPFSQQIILEEWYGKVAYTSLCGKLGVVFKYILSPILMPCYLFKFLFFERFFRISLSKSSLAQLMDFLFIPFICFLTDIVNYLILLGLLIATCVCTKERDEYEPHSVEIALWCCTISRVLIETDQMWQQGFCRYLKNMWNILELFSCTLILVAAIYRIIMWQKLSDLYDPAQDLLNATYLYAITEFLLILRWLNFLEFFPGLGPLLIALRIMIGDVFKFVMIVLFTCVLGAAIAVHSVLSAERSLNKVEGGDPDDTPAEFNCCTKEVQVS